MTLRPWIWIASGAITGLLCAVGVVQLESFWHTPAPMPPADIELSATAKGVAGKSIALSAPTKGATVKWIYPDTVEIITGPTGKDVRFITDTPGVYTVYAYTMVRSGWWGERLTDPAKCVVTVTGSGPTPPNPPAPSDPLWPALQAAWATDVATAGTPHDAAGLAAIYRLGATTYIHNYTQVADLLLVLHAAADKLPAGMQKTRRVLADELDRQVPSGPASKITPTTEAQFVAQFTRFASLLEALK